MTGRRSPVSPAPDAGRAEDREAGFTLVEVAAGLVLGSIGLALVVALLLLATRQATRWQADVEATAALHVFRTRLTSELRTADTLWTAPDGFTLSSPRGRTRYAVRSDTLYRDGRPVLPPAVRSSPPATYAWAAEELDGGRPCSLPEVRRPSFPSGPAVFVVVQFPFAVRSRPRAVLACAAPRRGPLVVRAGPPRPFGP